MSYRVLKRVLGETSLERKCRFLFGAALLLLITASFFWYGSQTEKLVRQQNRISGQLLVDQAMLTKHWGEMPGENPNSDLEKNRQFVEYMRKNLSKVDGTVEWIRPDAAQGPAAPADEFEAAVREKFLKKKPDPKAAPDAPEFEERFLPGAKYQYFQPIRVDDSCLLVCHGAPPGGSGIDAAGSEVPFGGSPRSASAPRLSEGDIFRIARVTISNGPTQEKLNWNRAILISTAIITVFLAMVTSYVIVRYVIVKPLRHLRDVSDAISRGNIALRADIRSGDEFEEVSAAFNRMLRHLVTAQEELRQVNVNLDGKVDELAQANMRLYEMNTIKSDFLATMSHELRTPLNSILGFSDVLGSIDSLDDKQKRYVQNIQKSGRTLLEMINDILDLAKMESGKMDIRLTDFRIAQVVGAQCDMARPLAERKNIDLDTSIEPDLPPMRQDQNRVQQVLNNLLSNAIKFTPEGGRVTVSVRRDGEDFLVMQVSDTGVGIAEEDQQVIFEKFRQGRVGAPSGDAMTREYSGSGLGLSIVKELCKLLGGGISVASELGKGSTFTVRLPWTLRDQIRLDSPVADGFDEITRPRFELTRKGDL
jgi:two-component system, NarL family, sensor histidine kinase BarA